MCTLTVIAASAPERERDQLLVRVMFNRDEQRTRPASLPLRIGAAGARSILSPIDPLGGGTWIGVNDAGLAACLLNATRGGEPTTARASRELSSRGLIVPRLLAAESLERALRIASDIDPARFPGFRAVILDRWQAVVIASDGAGLSIGKPAGFDRALMLTSSGLGDELVQRPRQDVFTRLVLRATDDPEAQASFHADRSHDRGELNVLMSRPDARTVSRTSIEIGLNHARVRHALLDQRTLEPETQEFALLSYAPGGVAA